LLHPTTKKVVARSKAASMSERASSPTEASKYSKEPEYHDITSKTDANCTCKVAYESWQIRQEPEYIDITMDTS